MNYRLKPGYSVVLMSQRSNAPYNDRIHDDGLTIEYEGHDIPKSSYEHNPKQEDQPSQLPSGKLTQNGLFIKAIEAYKTGKRQPELVKVYEKILAGVWSLKGVFNLVDYNVVNDGKRNVFRFIMELAEDQDINIEPGDIKVSQTRVIPTDIKKEVWKRDQGKCVLCSSKDNLHFDHDLPYSKGGTSLSVNNIRLLCTRHNLQKSSKIE